MKQNKYTVVRGNSLYELDIQEKYLGETNIKNSMESGVLTRLKPMENKFTGLFLDEKGSCIVASNIEGIKFQASATPFGVNQFKPNLRGQHQDADAGTPIFEFQIRPPSGRNMYAFGQYDNGKLTQIVMGISTKLNGDDNKFELRRPPIPNCQANSASICLGNGIRGDDYNFDIQKFPKVIMKLISGGWNHDWYQNQAVFVETNGKMINRWSTPISHMSECRVIGNATLTSIVNLLEREPTKLNKIGLHTINTEENRPQTGTARPTLTRPTIANPGGVNPTQTA